MVKRYDKLGTSEDVPVVDRTARPDTSLVAPGDWSVLGRVDGRRTIHQLAYESGMATDQVITALTNLKKLGLIHLKGEESGNATVPPTSSPDVAARPRPPVSRSIRPTRTGSRSRIGAPTPAKKKKTAVRVPYPVTWPIPISQFTFDPLDLETEAEIGVEKRQQVLYYHYHLEKVTHYELFQLEATSGDREIRRAYFKLSKEFHPDLFFRKDLGAFKRRIEEVFRWISQAYATLTDVDKRVRYDAALRAKGKLQGPSLVQDSIPHSDHLEKGREAEAKGNLRRAMHFYQAGLNAAFTVDLAVHAARCLLELGEDLDEAERLCKRASSAKRHGTHRVDVLLTLASVYGAQGRHDVADELYHQVQKIDPGNAIASAGLEGESGA
jgi:hypothetical protein